MNPVPEGSGRAVGGVPLSESPGQSVRDARRLVTAANEALRAAVCLERARGTSWEEIGQALGTKRSSAHSRFSDAVDEMEQNLTVMELDLLEEGVNVATARLRSAGKQLDDAWQQVLEIHERRAMRGDLIQASDEIAQTGAKDVQEKPGMACRLDVVAALAGLHDIGKISGDFQPEARMQAFRGGLVDLAVEGRRVRSTALALWQLALREPLACQQALEGEEPALIQAWVRQVMAEGRSRRMGGAPTPTEQAARKWRTRDGTAENAAALVTPSEEAGVDRVSALENRVAALEAKAEGTASART